MSPPPGRPSWCGPEELDLIYLGWGKRDFAKDPVIVHRDRGSNYYILLHGEIILTVSGSAHIVRGPSALIFDPGCAFGLSARNRKTPKILVWVWRGRPQSPALLPPPDGYLVVHLHQCPLDSLIADVLGCGARCLGLERANWNSRSRSVRATST